MSATFRDLTPEMTEVPPETWANIDSNALVDRLVRALPEAEQVNTASLSLRGLASRAQILPPSGQPRELLQELSPDLLATLDQEAANSRTYHA